MSIDGLSVVIPARDEPESLDYVLRMMETFSKYTHEVIVIVDSKSDSTMEIKERLGSYKLPINFILNPLGGISNAIRLGVNHSNSEYILIAMADEIVPVITFDLFYEKLKSGSDIVSATRYSNGGARYGGNRYGKFFSFAANKMMSFVFPNTFSDFTTGMKAFRKSQATLLLNNIEFGGWAPALKIAVNSVREGLNISEVPIVSVDRLLDGKSSFKLGSWIVQYMKALVAK